MTSPATRERLPTASRRPRLTKNGRIGLGLLFTFAGLFLLSILLPPAPGSFGRVLPAAAAGMLLLWIGGILMGVGSRTPSA